MKYICVWFAIHTYISLCSLRIKYILRMYSGYVHVAAAAAALLLMLLSSFLFLLFCLYINFLQKSLLRQSFVLLLCWLLIKMYLALHLTYLSLSLPLPFSTRIYFDYLFDWNYKRRCDNHWFNVKKQFYLWIELNGSIQSLPALTNTKPHHFNGHMSPIQRHHHFWLQYSKQFTYLDL